MTEQKLRFSIGSEFSGEGFQAAKNAVNNLNNTAKNADGVIGKLAGVIGGLDTKASQTTKAVTGLIQSFMSLNPVTIAVTAVTAAFSFAINECNKRQEEAKKRTEALRESLKAVQSDFNASFIKKIGEEIKSVSKEFEKCTKLANALTESANKLNSARGENDVIGIEIQKMKESFAAVDDDAKKLSDAYYDAVIAEKKLTNVKADQTAKLESAFRDRVRI